MRFSFFIISLFVATSLPLSAYEFEQTYPWHTTDNLKDIIYTGSEYIAVGQYGSVISSVDGRTWKHEPLATGFHLNSVTIFKGEIYAGGSRGTIIKKSKDSWGSIKPITESEILVLRATPYGLVAGCNDGTILFSPDGKNWKNVTPDQARGQELTGVTSSKDTVLIHSLKKIFYSTDGKKWNNSDYNYNEYNVVYLYYDGKRFIAYPLSWSPVTSADGKKWTWSGMRSPSESVVQPNGTRYDRYHFLFRPFALLTYRDTLFAIDSGAKLYTLTKGDKDYPLWKKLQQPPVENNSWFAATTGRAAASRSGIVVTGSKGAILLLQGDSLEKQEIIHEPFTEVMGSIACGKQSCVAAGRGIVIKNSSGRWVKVVDGADKYFNSLAYCNGTYVAVGSKGVIFTSADEGKHWKQQKSPVTADLDIVACGTKGAVAVSTSVLQSSNEEGEDTAREFALYSSNLANWKEYDPKFQSIISDIIWLNGRFIAAGRAKDPEVFYRNTGKVRIFSSPDGKSWKLENEIDSQDLPKLGANGDRMMMVLSDKIYFASNLQKLSSIELPEKNFWNKILQTDDGFLLFGRHGLILHSSDGLNWEMEPFMNNFKHLYDGVWFDGHLIAVTQTGSIIESIKADPTKTDSQ